MRVRALTLNCEEYVQRANGIVGLRAYRGVSTLHRIGRRWLFRVVNNCVGPSLLEEAVDKSVIGEVADPKFDFLWRQFTPPLHPRVQRRDRSERFDALFKFPTALRKIVCDPHLVTGCRKMHGRRPAQIAIATQYQDSHMNSLIPIVTKFLSATFNRGEAVLPFLPQASPLRAENPRDHLHPMHGLAQFRSEVKVRGRRTPAPMRPEGESQ